MKGSVKNKNLKSSKLKRYHMKNSKWMNNKLVVTVKIFTDKCNRNNIGAFAAQAAFFILLSAIPFLLVFSSLLQYTPVTQTDVLSIVDHVTPTYISPLLTGVIDEVYSRTIGIISITALVAIWAAGKAIQYMTTGLNEVNDIYETRNWFVVRFWSVVYTLILVIAMIILLVFLVFANRLQDMLLDRGGLLPLLIGIRPLFRGLIVFGILIGIFTLLFKTLPNKKLTFGSQLPGAVICALAWYIFSFGLSIYVNYFHGFSMYGGLTTIVLLMIWLYFCMYIMLLCAEANVIFAELFARGRVRMIEKYMKKKEK